MGWPHQHPLLVLWSYFQLNFSRKRNQTTDYREIHTNIHRSFERSAGQTTVNIITIFNFGNVLWQQSNPITEIFGIPYDRSVTLQRVLAFTTLLGRSLVLWNRNMFSLLNFKVGFDQGSITVYKVYLCAYLSMTCSHYMYCIYIYLFTFTTVCLHHSLHIVLLLTSLP